MQNIECSARNKQEGTKLDSHQQATDRSRYHIEVLNISGQRAQSQQTYSQTTPSGDVVQN
jgi:hypothetical protein